MHDLLGLWEEWDRVALAVPRPPRRVPDGYLDYESRAFHRELQEWSKGTGIPVSELLDRMMFLRRCGMTREQVVGFLENLRYF